MSEKLAKQAAKGVDLKTIMDIVGDKTHKASMRYQHPIVIGRGGRVAEGGGLENRFPETGRGFESYSLRQEIQQWRDGRAG